jgi:phosphohistidine phosphatase
LAKPNDRRMELILWRHAEADDAECDLSRRLSAKGHRQAAWVAAWLQHRLPTRISVFTSPAEGARETALALAMDARVSERLAPGAAVSDVLELVDWPNRAGSVSIVVGHQPTLGRVAAHLIAGVPAELSIRKGGVWWIARRDREGKPSVVVRAVISPDVL